MSVCTEEMKGLNSSKTPFPGGEIAQLLSTIHQFCQISLFILLLFFIIPNIIVLFNITASHSTESLLFIPETCCYS